MADSLNQGAGFRGFLGHREFECLSTSETIPKGPPVSTFGGDIRQRYNSHLHVGITNRPHGERVMLGMETPIAEPHLKLVPSVEYQRYRVRCVRRQIYFRPKSETFHEFLRLVICWTFGEAWWKD